MTRNGPAFLIFFFSFPQSAAHPMPGTLFLLDVKRDGIAAELQIPLGELGLALNLDLVKDSAHILPDMQAELSRYLLEHIRPQSPDGRGWQVGIRHMRLGRSEQPYTGKFPELVVQLWMQPPEGAGPRRFSLHYDVIIHQLVTHKALVSIRKDWGAGQIEDAPAQIAVIQVDPATNTIPAVEVDLGQSSTWKGFRSTVTLGMNHIAAGTDHLLFLLVLLLPAPLIARAGRWREAGDFKYGVMRLLRVTLAFTVGHSITLLAGSTGWLRLPSQPVEVLIACSILIGAVHALRPVFPGKEIWITAAFGLIHGLAFAFTLSDLHLEGNRLALSLLGFNVGIELRQLFVVLLVVPWLIILSGTKLFTPLRITSAALAGIAAVAWIAERLSGQANVVSARVEKVALQGKWVVLGLAVVAVASYLTGEKRGRLARENRAAAGNKE